MRDEPADLTPDAVREHVRRGWGLPVDSVRYQPVGAGSYNWTAGAGGRPRWFVKGDRVGDDGGERIHATFRAAAALRAAGLEFAVAPLPDAGGDLLRAVADGWALSVWPYLDAPAAGAGSWPDEGDLGRIAALLGRLHAMPVPAVAPRWSPAQDLLAGSIDAFVPELSTTWSGGPFGEAARELLTAAAPLVDRLATRYGDLVGRLERDDTPWVVTHGEPHSANVLVAADGRWLLIDWDSARVAPRERDFGAIEPTAAVRAAYATTAGPIALRPYVGELFRIEWDLVEVRWFANCLHDPHADTADARHRLDALRRYTDVGGRWPSLA